MTDKERLNEAYDWLAHVRKLAGETKDEGYFQRRLTTLEWLIEQAERVQELESRIADDEHFVAEILEQNKRLREVIIEAIADIEAISPHEAKKTLREALNNG